MHRVGVEVFRVECDVRVGGGGQRLVRRIVNRRVILRVQEVEVVADVRVELRRRQRRHADRRTSDAQYEAGTPAWSRGQESLLAADLGVGVGRAHKVAVAHVGQHDVVGVLVWQQLFV